MATARLRWRLLNDLDEWLALPMVLLSLAWLGIIVWELVSGSSALLETIGTAIWIVFIIEFALRFALAPANRSMNALQATLARRGFGYVAGLTFLVVGLGAAGMLSFENAGEVDGGLTDYGHALWWTGMLVASLGTDFWPQTTEGRLLAMLLALYGLAVFGYITATLASFFVGRDAERADAPLAGTAEMTRLAAEVRALRIELAERNAQ